MFDQSQIDEKLVQIGLFEEEPGCSKPDKGAVTNTVKFYLYFRQDFQCANICSTLYFCPHFQL